MRYKANDKTDLKNNRIISLHFQGKPFNITVIQVYAATTDAKEAEVDWFYEDPKTPSRTNNKKRCPFPHKRLEYKSRKSRENRQVWPWSTEWSREKANSVLSREYTGHSKHSLPTTWETAIYMDITRCLMPKSDWLCSLQPKMEKFYTVSKNKTGNWLCAQPKIKVNK